MTNKELQEAINNKLEELGIKVGKFEVSSFKHSSSINYKFKFSIDLICEGYGDKGFIALGRTLDQAIEDMVYFIEGNWDEEENKWF